MFEKFLDHCRAAWKPSPARAVAGESSAWSYCVPLLRAAPSYRRVTAGKIPGIGKGNAHEKCGPGNGSAFLGFVESKNRSRERRTTMETCITLSSCLAGRSLLIGNYEHDLTFWPRVQTPEFNSCTLSRTTELQWRRGPGSNMDI